MGPRSRRALPRNPSTTVSRSLAWRLPQSPPRPPRQCRQEPPDHESRDQAARLPRAEPAHPRRDPPPIGAHRPPHSPHPGPPALLARPTVTPIPPYALPRGGLRSSLAPLFCKSLGLEVRCRSLPCENPRPPFPSAPPSTPKPSCPHTHSPAPCCAPTGTPGGGRSGFLNRPSAFRQ